MLFSDRRNFESSTSTNGNQSFTVSQVTNGILEVSNNTSSGTVKTMPTGTDVFVAYPHSVDGDSIELLLWNGGGQSFTLAAGSGSDSLWGNPVIPAGSVCLIKMVRFGSDAMGIFVVGS